jgi:hypothetical protein
VGSGARSRVSVAPACGPRGRDVVRRLCAGPAPSLTQVAGAAPWRCGTAPARRHSGAVVASRGACGAVPCWCAHVASAAGCGQYGARLRVGGGLQVVRLLLPWWRLCGGRGGSWHDDGRWSRERAGTAWASRQLTMVEEGSRRRPDVRDYGIRISRFGRPWRWCRLAVSNVCSRVDALGESLLRASFWSYNHVARCLWLKT